jgi:hypothetical protein
MRRLLFVILATSLLNVTAVSAAGPDTILDEDFENGTDVFSEGAWGMEELSTGHDGAGLRSIIPAGEHWGGSGHWYFSDHGMDDPEELWWRYWVRFPDGFYIEPPNRGKLPGVGGLYTYNCLGGRPSTPEEPCFSARMLFSRTYPSFGEPGYPNGPDDKTLIGYYVYHLDSPATRGDIWTWDPDVATLDHGPWYCVEGHIELNTPGQHDGVLEGWVDGANAFARDDIAFRRTAEVDIDIKSFWFDVYYGGAESVVDNEIHFDSLALGWEKIGCDDGGVFTPPFRDDDGSVFESDIVWLSAAGITEGCNPPTNDRFCPDEPVTRGQMAAFLARALALPSSSGNTFGDDDGSVFESAIESLADAGITKGCNPPANDRFCPGQSVTRGEMAAFLARAFGLPPAAGDPFTDDNGSVFESAIESIAAAGITKGCNPPTNDRFCPGESVTRGQMAAFLHRAET